MYLNVFRDAVATTNLSIAHVGGVLDYKTMMCHLFVPPAYDITAADVEQFQRMFPTALVTYNTERGWLRVEWQLEPLTDMWAVQSCTDAGRRVWTMPLTTDAMVQQVRELGSPPRNWLGRDPDMSDEIKITRLH